MLRMLWLCMHPGRGWQIANDACFSSQGRYSFVGAQPALEVVARGHSVTVIDHATRQRTTSEEADPMQAWLQLTLRHSTTLQHPHAGLPAGPCMWAAHE